MQGTTLGATDLLTTRDELAEKEESLRLALEAGRLGAWEYHVQSGRVTWSSMLEKIHGLAPGTFGGTLEDYLSDVHPDDLQYLMETLKRTLEEGIEHHIQYRIILPDGQTRWVEGRGRVIRNAEGAPVRLTGVCTDITDRKQAETAIREQAEIIETVNRVGQALAAELDLQKIVQTVTDAATSLTGAQFGAFFYNVLDERGQSYMLYTLSGVPREAFANLPMPRATDLFGPTFRGEGTIRLDDVRKDSRYGRFAPHHGMPPGHLPVASYLAVPVISRSGEVLGGLFFGHEKTGVFTEHVQRIAEGLAAQAAVAIDNARFYEALEVERSKAQAAEQRFRDLVNGLDAIVWEADPRTLQFSFVSQRAEQMLGFPIERWLEEPNFWAGLIHPENREQVISLSLEAAAKGQARDLSYRTVTADGRVVWLRDIAHVTLDAEGQPKHLRGVMVDITHQKQVEETNRFLAEAGAVLTSSLNYQETLEQVAKLAVPAIADWCSLHIIEDGEIRQLAVAHPDPEMAELAVELDRRYPTDPKAPHGVPNVIRTGELEFQPEITDALLAAVCVDDEQLAIVRQLGLRSYIIAPLIARGRVLGALTLVSAESGRHYTTEDLPLAQEVASRAALAIDNSRLYHESKRAGEELKRRARQAALGADVGRAFTEGDRLQNTLQRCAESIVRHLNAAFARIWTLNAEENALELRASAGMYTHLDGPHRRAPVGSFKIGLIAQERAPHLTNDVQNDPRVSNREWAAREGMVAFAGYPLVIEDRLVGVMAMFAREPLAEDTLESLASVANVISQGIERKVAEEEIRRLNETLDQRVRERTAQLEEANKELESFSYSVSHDLRAPLRHIAGFAEFLQRRSCDGLDENGRRYVRNILDSSRQAGTLVDELLSFSRMGRAEMLNTQVDISVLIQEVRRSLEAESGGQRVQWQIGTLPIVEGDPAMLRLVFQNLLGNAVKYSRNAVQPVIEVGAIAGDQEAVFFVRDNGVG